FSVRPQPATSAPNPNNKIIDRIPSLLVSRSTVLAGLERNRRARRGRFDQKSSLLSQWEIEACGDEPVHGRGAQVLRIGDDTSHISHPLRASAPAVRSLLQLNYAMHARTKLRSSRSRSSLRSARRTRPSHSPAVYRSLEAARVSRGSP